MKTYLKTWRLMPLALMVAMVALIGPSASFAAPPSNDNFANAQVVGPALPIDVSGSTIEATAETGEPDHRAGHTGGKQSVWYSWTPAASGKVELDACNGFGFTPAVYTGNSVGSLTRVSAGESGGCRATLKVTAGQNYKVAVDAWFYPSLFTLHIYDVEAPGNDDLANAATIAPTLPASINGNNFGATAELGEPDHGFGGPDSSVWYRWTPNSTVQVTVSNCTTSGTLIMGAYTGSAVNGLTPVSLTSDELCGTINSGGEQITFVASAGTTYKIAVDSYDPSYGRNQGSFTMDLAVLPDGDGDGVPDAQDGCPTEPNPTGNDGCPWPDGDGDGVPDYEDECPDEEGPASNDGCPEPVVHERPETTLESAKIVQKKRSATFTFSSDQPDTFFVCKIDDKKWKGCDSPMAYKKLSPGKHKFLVEATSDFGGDRSPAKKSFKIKK
jgi:hypothetical protein